VYWQAVVGLKQVCGWQKAIFLTKEIAYGVVEYRLG
jgi:hypothetical protein